MSLGVPGTSSSERIYTSDRIIRVGVVGAGEVAQVTHVSSFHLAFEPYVWAEVQSCPVVAADAWSTLSFVQSCSALRRLPETP